ncbi:MAG: hypothetical protein ACRD29_07635 [Acidimicrobiales bacterium]
MRETVATHTRRTELGAVALGLAVVVSCTQLPSGRESFAKHEPPPQYLARFDADVLRSDGVDATVADLQAPGAGAGWLAVGSVFDPESGRSRAAVWEAPDARSWVRSDLQPADPGGSERLEDVAVVGPDRIMAISSIGEGRDARVGLWRRGPHGWEPLAAESIPVDRGTAHAGIGITGDGRGQVAFGTTLTPGGGGQRALVWFSDDAVTWDAVDGGEGGPFNHSGEAIRDGAAGPAGFVLVGADSRSVDEDAAVWFSADGRMLERVAEPALGGPGPQGINAVVAFGSGFVAAGYGNVGGKRVAAAWRSTDGRAWTATHSFGVVDDGRVTTGSNEVRALAVDGGSLVAAGGPTFKPHVWRSADGVGWVPIGNPLDVGGLEDGLALSHVATAGGQVLAGSSAPTLLLDAGGWADVAGTEAFRNARVPYSASITAGHGAVVVAGNVFRARPAGGSSRSDGVVWRWDGKAETLAVVDGAHDRAEVCGVATWPGGFVTIGQGHINGPYAYDLLMWTSPDGLEWSRNRDIRPPDLPRGSSQETGLVEAVAIADGVLAVGQVYSPDVRPDLDPIAYRSSDGVAAVLEDLRVAGVAGDGDDVVFDACGSADGTVVLVGDDNVTVDGSDGMWLRRDPAGSWARATAADGSFGGDGRQQVVACAPQPGDGWVAVGSTEAPGHWEPAVWESDDGLTWQRVELGPEAFGDGSMELRSVVGLHDGRVLLGGAVFGYGASDGALWLLGADDNVTRVARGQRALGGEGAQTVNGLAIEGDHVYLIGEDYGRAGFWSAPLDELLAEAS